MWIIPLTQKGDAMRRKKEHTLYPELVNSYEKGDLSRREFLRYSALIGVSMGLSATMLGTLNPRKAMAMASKPKRGGVLKVAGSVHKITHPAQFSWVEPSNQMRQVAQYLTVTGPDNITRPYLCEKWEASDDLKTWTLHLVQNATFNYGDKFNADDVLFTIGQWLDPEVKSSMLGLMGAYLKTSGIEKIDTYTVRLHLERAEIAVPEHLFHYPALILNHRTFEGDFLRAPHGTGPYTLEKYKEGEICILKARKDYWQKGFDKNPLPYLDGMQFIEVGKEISPKLAALKSGEVHMIDFGDNPTPEAAMACKGDDRLVVLPVTTAGTRVIRMRTDIAPFSDVNVRNAIKYCQNHEKLLGLAYMNEGMMGQDVHVYPYHPEYCEMPARRYQPEKARELLKKAGKEGLKVELSVGSSFSDAIRIAEVLKQDGIAGGIDIQIKTMPTSQYWEKWTELPFGITPWAHRPLGTMVLNLAYACGLDGKPVPWNETRWVDDEFNTLLKEANGTLDVASRRKIFCKLQKIQQERGSIGIPFWMNLWLITSKKLKNVEVHPSLYMDFNEVYLDA